MTPGAPATCKAAVRAIWLARPATRVSKVNAVLSRWEVAAGALDRGDKPASAGMPSASTATAAAATALVRRNGIAGASVLLGATDNSSRTGVPASSDSTRSMRLAYCARIQSSLKRLGTRTTSAVCGLLSAPPAGAVLTASGRIQVLNCCSGNSAARRSHARCHKSRLIVDIFFLSCRILRPSQSADRSYPHKRRQRQPPLDVAACGASV